MPSPQRDIFAYHGDLVKPQSAKLSLGAEANSMVVIGSNDPETGKPIRPKGPAGDPCASRSELQRPQSFINDCPEVFDGFVLQRRVHDVEIDFHHSTARLEIDVFSIEVITFVP